MSGLPLGTTRWLNENRATAQAGVGIEVVSERLGHSTIGITMDRDVTVYCERDVTPRACANRP
jgi:hypothetical protein